MVPAHRLRVAQVTSTGHSGRSSPGAGSAGHTERLTERHLAVALGTSGRDHRLYLLCAARRMVLQVAQIET